MKKSTSVTEAAKTTQKHYLGHRKRMRRKLIECPSSLSNYELLEVLLYYVLPRRDTKEQAKKLVAHFGSIRNIIFSQIRDLEQIKGIGKACATLFSVIHEIFVRASFEEVKKDIVIASNSQVIEYYKNVFCNIEHEQLRIMFLNSKNLLIADEISQEGTINQTVIYPRMIIKRAFELGAAAIIMAHNHPSGDTHPSRQDIVITQAMKELTSKLDIALLDHLIIGKNDVFSMKEHSIV